jgi:hypothetical protein
MMRKIVLFLLLISFTLSACLPTSTPTPEVQTEEEAQDVPTAEPILTQTSDVSKTSEVSDLPTAIGTMSAGGLENLATIYLSPTGTLEAELNLGYNDKNPIPFDLANGVYKLGMAFTGYTFNVSRTAENGYEYFQESDLVKIAFGGPGSYTVSLDYILTPTAGGKTISGKQIFHFNVTGSIPSGSGSGSVDSESGEENGNDSGGSSGGSGGEGGTCWNGSVPDPVWGCPPGG